MTAEQLNIKINLDLAGLQTQTKRVKDQFNGIKKSVKESLPQITKESDKAEGSLGDVEKAAKRVKSSLGDVGKEAKTSFDKVTKEASKLKDMKFGASFDGDSDGIEQASVALDGLKGRLTALTGINIFAMLGLNWEKAAGFFKRVTENGFLMPLTFLKRVIQDIGKIIKSHLTKNVKEADKAMTYLKYDKKKFFQDLKDVIKNLGAEFLKFAKTIGAVGLALGAALGAIAGASIANNTKQFREEQSKLNSAFQAAGASAKEAGQAYNGLFRFLGQSDRAVEAANHLAKITTNAKDLAEWTTIAQGVYATFGNSLQIEGLTEAANETIRVGKVTGVMADALNWAGVSEDAMNAKLEKATTLAEREAIIRQTLSGLYTNAAKIYEENNKHLIAQNEAQARLDATMAKIGHQTQVLTTSWINFKNTLMTAVGPAIIYISAAVSVLLDKLAALIQWLGSLFGISFDVGSIDGISTGLNNATNSADDLKNSLNAAGGAAEKLKKTTMGFDELNVVSNPKTSGGGGGGGDTTGITGITGEGVVGQIGEKIEMVKEKVEEFFDKWKTQIAIIGGALAALGIANLLTGLGKALGLGEGFLGIIKTIKKVAASAIVITLQYTLVNEFLDKFIDGEGFKNYILAALTTAIGSGLLYAMWGPAGLAIGLGVTAVASIKSIIDNGGITNMESATVAFTGVATAIGAIVSAVAAFKKVGFLEALTLILGGAKNMLLGVPAFLSTWWTNIVIGLKMYWAQITGFLSKSWTVLFGGITKALGLVKTAFSTVISFIIANPITLVIAAIVALVALIAVKGDEIQNLLNKVSNWIKNFFVRDWREVFGNTLGTLMNGFVKIAGDILGNLKKMLNGLIDFIRGIFTGDWKRAWEGIKQIFGGIFGGLTALAKAPINAIITMINTALSAITSGFNGIKRILNGLSINIPDWVPVYGGKKFGFNFQMSTAPQIPMLAEGGIVVGETLARIGEGGKKEAVLPLEQNTGWMDTLADKIAAKQGGAPTKVQLVIDGNELGWATINNINKITRQTGGLQLVL